MNDFTMTIGGERCESAATFEVHNPATGEVFAEAPEATEPQLEEAIAAAARALEPSWCGDEDRRRDALRRAAGEVRASIEEIAPVLTAEQGRPLPQAIDEVATSAVWLDYFADLEVGSEVVQDDAKARVEVVRRPIGVVAAIAPWNFPLLLACWKLAPALRAGNTVVLKPSPYTPLSTLLLVAALDRALPPGVVNVVSGGDELGAHLTRHPVPRKIAFTGSIETGRRVAVAAAKGLKRTTLELGGNDAAIVLEDADPKAIARRLFVGAFLNSGQVCTAIKRLYVAEALHDELVEALAERARAAKVGDGVEEGTELGPLTMRPQFDRVRELVDDALSEGGEAVAGGAPLERPGWFYPPTIVTGVREGVRLVDEEQFGPAVPVIPFVDPEEALRRANATHFGLTGSVWSADPDRAAALAARLECGTVRVNTHVGIGPHQPFGGLKWSGLGVENGPWGLEAFTELQVRYRSKR